MRIVYSKSAAKFIKSQSGAIKKRLHDAILGLLEKPMRGDIKPLRGFSDGRMRLRVGGIRVIFKIEKNGDIDILFVMDIGSRGDIYK